MPAVLPPRRHFRRPTAPPAPPDEFCPEVPLTWQRAMRKVSKLPRLNKMKITIPNERVVTKSNRQWLTKRGRVYRRVGLDPALERLFGLGPPAPPALSPADDLHHESEEHAQLVDRFMTEILAETGQMARWDNISQMDLDSNQAPSPDADSMMAKVFKEVAASSLGSIESIVARTYHGTPDDDDIRSVLAHDLAQQIVNASRGTSPLVHASEVQSELGTDWKGSEVCAMLREFLNPSPADTIENMENMDVGVGMSDAQRLSDTDMVATHLARHMIQSIQSISRFSSPKLDIPSSASASAIDGSHSQLAQSLAQKILVNLESSASPHSEQAEQAEDGCIDVPVLEGDWNPASNVSNGHSAVPSDAAIDMAKGVIFGASSHSAVPAHSDAASHGQLSQNTDSVVAQSITRNLIVGGMCDSDVRSQSGHIPEEALSDGYAVNGVAREVIVSAAAQEVPTQLTAPSSYIESEGAVSHAVQLVARDTFAEHATVPYASSLPKDLVEQPRSDADGGAEVQAILRKTIDGACSGTSAQSKIPPSQQESEHADSMVAGSVARQIIAPHAAAGSNSRDVEEQVHSEAEGYVDAVEQAVAREFVASASNLQGVPQPSHEQLSQKTDSVVPESITRNLIAGGMYESDVRSQSGHIPEEALSDGYAMNGVAREVIVSAAAQEVPTQRTAPSSHIESEGAVSHAVQLVARDTFAEHATVPYASSLPKDLVEQPRSDADGGAEVQAILRQTIDGACSGTSAQSKIPPSQQESEHADSMVAGSVARQIIAPHAAAGSNSRDVEEQVHSEAEGYVDAVEQAVAREFVASASDLQHVPRTNPSSEVCSEKTDSAVAQSLAKEATLPYVLE